MVELLGPDAQITYKGYKFLLTREGHIKVTSKSGRQWSHTTMLRFFVDEEFRTLVREALLALDEPLKWKGISTNIPPHMRAPGSKGATT